ncbi:hypothetical protein AAC387_Pa11g2153 [Persea americana]
MKGREGGRVNGGNPTDLLVCFPSRAHLTLMPKPICSPSRPSNEPSKRHHHRPMNRGQASPLFKTKPKHTASEISEPTSPKVTCAGQIKVRPKPTPSCKNWQSVMEEIEKIHNSSTQRKKRKKPTWVESLGLKKDIMQFLTTLRSIRFDLRCFGSFHGSVVNSDSSSDDEEEEEDKEENEEEEKEASPSRTIFSKWFMVLQENQSHGSMKEEGVKEDGGGVGSFEAPVVPPSNALLLMRCRSAPAKGWIEEKARDKVGEGDEEVEEMKSANMTLEEEKKKEKLVLMSYAPDFFKVSPDIAKETWVVGRRDPFSRSRSWKR